MDNARAPSAHVHRFRDRAALAILRHDGTVYLSETDARALAAALIQIADSIASERFADSPPLSASVPALASD